MARIKRQATLFLLSAVVFFSPSISTAGSSAQGSFKDRMKQKLEAPKNIQYNYEAQGIVIQDEGSRVQSDTVAKERNRPQDYKDMPQEYEASPILSAYAIYRADYKADIEEDVVTVKGTTLFEVFKKGWTQIPLARSDIGLIDVSVNRGTSFVTSQNGRYYLMIDKPGRYTLDMEFLIKAARERENGPGSFNFEVTPAPISQFEFSMPEQDVDIFIDPSIKLEVKREPKKTIAWAVMPNTSSISVRWTKALPKETITHVKLEPKVYADTATYASIGEGVIRCQTNLNYSILQSEVSTLRIALPEDVSILEVKGSDLRDWKASTEAGTQYVDVYLNFGVKGSYMLSISYEKKIGEGSAVAQIPWVKAMGAEREKGYFGLAAASNVELAVNKTDGSISQIDVRELPVTIWSSTANPILLALKYLAHPFSIAIDVIKHEELPVRVAAIDSAEYITLYTDEGKSLTKAVYQVRNNVKQFIHLVLPREATLWSVFVAGKPVKPAKDKLDTILIPLEKSQYSGENLTQFPVEVVYLDKASKMGLLGSLKLGLPQTDIPISSLHWGVYLPLDYSYFNFGGNVKEQKRRGMFLPAVGGAVMQMKKGVRYEDKVGSSDFAPQQARNLYEQAQSVQSQGLLSIKIDIPQEGRLYNFSKLLVTEQESAWLSVVYLTVFKQVQGAIRFVLFLTALFFAGVYIKKRFFKR